MFNNRFDDIGYNAQMTTLHLHADAASAHTRKGKGGKVPRCGRVISQAECLVWRICRYDFLLEKKRCDADSNFLLH